MSIEQLISTNIPILSPEDIGSKALDLMQDNNITQLPVVSEDNYIALIDEKELLEWDAPQNALSTSGHLTYRPAIASLAHPFEAMRVLHDMSLAVLPVIDGEGKFVGCITKEALLKYITENSGVDNPGGILVLELPPRNYSLYEIARVCENEDVIILNMQTHANAAGMLEVTLKLNRTVLDAVVSSFERHNYHVKEVYGEESNNEDIQDKYHLLMNYINM